MRRSAFGKSMGRTSDGSKFLCPEPGLLRYPEPGSPPSTTPCWEKQRSCTTLRGVSSPPPLRDPDVGMALRAGYLSVPQPC